MPIIAFIRRRWPRVSALAVIALSACGGAASGLWSTIPPEADASAAYTERLRVTATAYNSTRAQTQGDPFLSACGARLAPGMKVIAVSRELFRTQLKCGQRVFIEELGEEYVVLDTMNRRWRRKIDLYMGLDIAAARRWGRREVTIAWDPEAPRAAVER